jgi:hypothetical protein
VGGADRTRREGYVDEGFGLTAEVGFVEQRARDLAPEGGSSAGERIEVMLAS